MKHLNRQLCIVVTPTLLRVVRMPRRVILPAFIEVPCYSGSVRCAWLSATIEQLRTFTEFKCNKCPVADRNSTHNASASWRRGVGVGRRSTLSDAAGRQERLRCHCHVCCFCKLMFGQHYFRYLSVHVFIKVDQLKRSNRLIHLPPNVPLPHLPTAYSHCKVFLYAKIKDLHLI